MNSITLHKDPPCYVFAFSVDGPISHINNRFLQQLGYTHADVLGEMRMEDLLTAGSKIFYKTHFLPMLMMQERVEEMFLTFKSKSGDEFPVLMNLELNNEGEDQQIQAVGLHIAKRNKFEKGIIEAKEAAEKALMENELLLEMRARLERNQENLERQLRNLKRINFEHLEFSKVLSHDMQEPLRKIVLFAGLLEAKYQNNELDSQLNSYLCKLSDISEKARSLLIKLQNFHSLEDRMNKNTKGDLEVMIENALERINNKKIKPDLSRLKAKEVYGDIPRLTRVFRELLENSYKFRCLNRLSSITISSDLVKENYYWAVENAYRYTDFIQIRFQDNGIGFPPNSEDKIFRLLQKFHANSGTGLGLAYCKKIVELHHGRIVMKPCQGGGTLFTILLPTYEEWSTE
ncbi:sensor histidine kinase [Sediminicola sp. 1XM1-17]|uniref:sensor histidine kinase n=1 Tax=Sediminicola sp. 1XM1-17 TaxID=3127702 RepID=UPI0030785F18